MVHVKWSRPNFNDLEHENVNISKNGFYQRILQASEYPKRERAKKYFFLKTLLDGPLYLKLTNGILTLSYSDEGELVNDLAL